MKNLKDVVYSLNIEDVQTVAVQEIGRELNDNEIKEIINLIYEKIPWYDAIANSISEAISHSTANND